jgi:nucleotide-binding universal stress UspA family protein
MYVAALNNEFWDGFKKILVPLDGSSEAERVIGLAQSELAENGAFILMQVIPPAKNQKIGEHVILSTQQEEADRAAALGYLKSVAQEQPVQPAEWLFEVAISNSVVDEIVNIARREQVDLVAMYTHDRRGLAKMIKGSIAQKVKEKSPVEVRAFLRRELEPVGA